MRKLLIEDCSQEVVLTAVQEFIPLDFKELKDCQKEDNKLAEVIRKVERSKGPKDFSIRGDVTLSYKNRIVIPADQELKERVLKEAHKTPYTAHPDSAKLYQDLKQYFWWERMKNDVVEFVNKFSICRLSLQNLMGTNLKFSSAYHLQTNGQAERMIQTLEDILRPCIMEHEGIWEKQLPLVEFAYNNSFQVTIQMVPYEALYGRKYRSSLHWDEVGKSKVIGLEVLQEIKDHVHTIRERMRTTQSIEELR
ncbi:uncharacterized protein LOC121262103 [Juglans microcarpa x Juglans regia]|uniref:uncharacterized protein LOC121262103 n=1 Tax=Juglans microcarpa x Juglans regia TaxID=2249226 RepID=UPI001B7DF0B9|nr:uncharacterized protein LOC121262103 [Juglans microcarpa x Juglans regia]